MSLAEVMQRTIARLGICLVAGGVIGYKGEAETKSLVPVEFDGWYILLTAADTNTPSIATFDFQHFSHVFRNTDTSNLFTGSLTREATQMEIGRGYELVGEGEYYSANYTFYFPSCYIIEAVYGIETKTLHSGQEIGIKTEGNAWTLTLQYDTDQSQYPVLFDVPPEPGGRMPSVIAVRGEKVRAYLYDYTGASTNVVWSIEDPNLDCSIDPDTGVITLGDKPGILSIKAAMTDHCDYWGTIRLRRCECQDCALGSQQLRQEGSRVEVRFGLGGADDDVGAGDVVFSTELPDSVRIGDLEVLADDESVRIIKSEGALAQVKVQDGLVTVDWVSTNQWKLKVYENQNVGSLVNGLYTIATNSPFVEYWLERPATNQANARSLKERRGGQTVKEFAWSYDSTNGVLRRTDGGSVAQVDTWTATGTDVETNIVEIKSSSGSIAVHEEELYTDLSQYSTNWGRVLTQSTVGTDSARRETVYTYYTNLKTNSSAPLIKQISYPDGRWEFFEYGTTNAVGTNALSRKFFSFMNQEATNSPSLCESIDYSYASEDTSVDDLTFRPDLPRREIRKIKGQEVGRLYRALQPGEEKVIACPDPGLALTNSANQISITRYYTNGAYRDWVQSLMRPDTTMEFYAYADDGTNITTTVSDGAANGSGTGIENGRQTVIVKSDGRVVSKKVYAIEAGTVKTNLVLESEEHSQPDSLGRLRKVTYLDGSTTWTEYGCCGVEFHTNRFGVRQEAQYDSIGRNIGELLVPFSLKTLVELDPSEQVIKRYRVGSDSTTNVLARYGYNNAGLLVAETNALDGTTTISEYVAGGFLVRTSTYPNASVRIESYFKDGSLASVTGTGLAGVRFTNDVEQVDGIYRRTRKELKLAANGSDLGEWEKTFEDGLGRTIRKYASAESGASTPVWRWVYNSKGQLQNEIDPDGVTTIKVYDTLGLEKERAIDLVHGAGDAVATPDYAVDRITRTTREVSTNSFTGEPYGVERISTYVWDDDNGTNAVLSYVNETSLDRLRSWNTRINIAADGQTNIVTEALVATVPGGTHSETVDHSDSSFTIRQFEYGRLISTTRTNTGTQLSRLTLAYDTHGRVLSETDARNGISTITYNAADLMASKTLPVPGTGQAAQTSYQYFDNALQLTNVVYPDGASQTTIYGLNGRPSQEFGARRYAVGYGYDSQNRLTALTNWTTFPSAGERVTRWLLSTNTGRLKRKEYADGNGTDYTYTGAGRLSTRVWARSVTTTYGYNPAGDLASTLYSDTTPDMSALQYDRRGRLEEVSRVSAGTTNTVSYLLDRSGNVRREAYSGGTLDGFSVTNTFDSILLRRSVAIHGRSDTLVGFCYDDASRLSRVTNGTWTATYTYSANSDLHEAISYKNSGSEQLLVSKRYDKLNRLGSIRTVSSAPRMPISFVYGYNQANQRERSTLGDGSSWAYGYDSLGQVTSAKRRWPDYSLAAGQQFEYAYDEIGDRSTTKAGGDSSGGSLRTASYSVNSVNAYSQRTVPADPWSFDVVGIAGPTNTVTVNGGATTRKGEYFHDGVMVTNSAAAVYLAVSVSDGGTSTNRQGNVFVPKTPEVFTHDLDGNLTGDGRWTYTWDAENRLMKMESASTAPTASKRLLEFEYDYLGRRIKKSVSTNSGSAYVLQYSRKFLYDGWTLLAELDGTNTVQSYVWGEGLGGSAQSSGGVGALLMSRSGSGVVCLTAYDGNGNVVGYYDPADTNWVARYEYGPFGEVIRMTGAMAKANPFRWSTKYTDDESGLVYYGYRYYNPSTGRWISRDPIGEEGGMNLYGFVKNRPQTAFDYLGLEFIDEGHEIVFMLFAPGTTGDGRTSFRLKSECRRIGVTVCSYELRLLEFKVRTRSSISQYGYFRGEPYDEWNSPIPRVSDDSIAKVIDHEAQHRQNFRRWHDENYPTARNEYRGSGLNWLVCEMTRRQLDKKYIASWEAFYQLENEHSPLNDWPTDFAVPIEYAPQDGWWYGDLPPRLDDPVDP